MNPSTTCSDPFLQRSKTSALSIAPKQINKKGTTSPLIIHSEEPWWQCQFLIDQLGLGGVNYFYSSITIFSSVLALMYKVTTLDFQQSELILRNGSSSPEETSPGSIH